MTVHAVHWAEGVFLKPHHFQAALRYHNEQVRRQQMWDMPYGWGLQAIDLDREALTDHRALVRRLSARFPDGTAIEMGPDDPLAERSLREILRTRHEVDLFVGVPSLVLGANWPNLATDGDGRGRFRARELRCVDENTGLNPQTISVRRLNVRLFVGDEDRAGYQSMPIARIVKSDTPDATPIVDAEFIPPLLRCDIWPALQEDILYGVVERINRKIDDLGQRVKKEGITFERHQRDGPRILHQLAKLNEAASVLRVLLHVQGLHPLWAFTELSRVVGQLAIFGADRRTPVRSAPLRPRQPLRLLRRTEIEPRQLPQHRRGPEVPVARLSRQGPAHAGGPRNDVDGARLAALHRRALRAGRSGVHRPVDPAGQAQHEDRQQRPRGRNLHRRPFGTAFRPRGADPARCCPPIRG